MVNNFNSSDDYGFPDFHLVLMMLQSSILVWLHILKTRVFEEDRSLQLVITWSNLNIL